MTLALLFTAQHVSDVNTSIFRSLRLLVALCRLTWGVLVLCSGIGCWWCGIRVQAVVVVQPVLGYHITNRQSRYITPTRLKSAQYSLHNKAPSSRKLLKMDVLTSETCWAVDNKASVIRLVNLYSNNARSNTHEIVLIRCMRACRMSGAWVPLLNLGTRWKWSTSYPVHTLLGILLSDSRRHRSSVQLCGGCVCLY